MYTRSAAAIKVWSGEPELAAALFQTGRSSRITITNTWHGSVLVKTVSANRKSSVRIRALYVLR